jgi:hypothetical protein
MGATTSSSNSVTTYGLYQLPYTSSAINVNIDDLKKCLTQTESTDIGGLRTCVQNNVSSAQLTFSSMSESNKNLNVKYFGPGETVMTNVTTVTNKQPSLISQPSENSETTQTVTKKIQPAQEYPISRCYEGFNSNGNTDDDNYDDEYDEYDPSIESNKLFCFNGTFTLLTIFVLVLLLIFIGVNAKK